MLQRYDVGDENFPEPYPSDDGDWVLASAAEKQELVLERVQAELSDVKSQNEQLQRQLAKTQDALLEAASGLRPEHSKAASHYRKIALNLD